jgi:hypothetical protein
VRWSVFLFSGLVLLIGIGLYSQVDQACSGGYCITLGHPYETIGYGLIILGVLGMIVGVALTHQGNAAGFGSSSSPTLSHLGRTILEYAGEKKDPAEIAALTKVDPKEVEEKIANLKEGGFLTLDGQLTAKGFEAVHAQQP